MTPLSFDRSSSFTKDLHGSLRPLGKNSSPELCSKEIVKIFNLICTDFLFLQGQKKCYFAGGNSWSKKSCDQFNEV